MPYMISITNGTYIEARMGQSALWVNQGNHSDKACPIISGQPLQSFDGSKYLFWGRLFHQG